MATLLPIVIFLPLLAGFLAGSDPKSARRLAIIATSATLAATIWPAYQILLSSPSTIIIALDLPWILYNQDLFEVRFNLGLDGLSIWPFGLTCLAMLLLMVTTDKYEARYYRLLLLMQTALLGLFAARDAILFLIFFQLVTIPFILLLGFYTDNGRRSLMRLICIEAAGATAVLLGLLALVAIEQYPLAQQKTIPDGLRLGIFVTLVAGFTVRVLAPPLLGRIKTDGNISALIVSFLPTILLALSGIYGTMRFARPIYEEVHTTAWSWAFGMVVGGAICAGMFCAAVFTIEKGTAA